MDALHKEGVDFIHFLQTDVLTHQPTVDAFVKIPQYLADPDTLVIFAFPLLLAFNRWLACRFALTIGMVDMANTILKWMLQGERPYWWIREANQTSLGVKLPELQQLPLTCETGPGSPSGHSMSSAAVGFVFVSAIIDQYTRKLKSQSTRHFIEAALWFVYALVVALIGIARLILATHFPHQVILGSAAGVAGGWLVWNLPIERIRKKHFLIFTLSMFLWAVLTYFILQFMGIDPNRTVELALKHCIVRDYVKLTTTPWHSVYRNSALMLAAGLCATSSSWRNVLTRVRYNFKEQLTIAVLSLAIAQALASVPYPHQPAFLFYICAFVKNVVIVLCCMLLVPLSVLNSAGSIALGSKTQNGNSVVGKTVRQRL